MQAARPLPSPGGHDPPPGWLTVTQTAQVLAITARRVRQLCCQGRLTAQRVATGDGLAWHIDPACRPALALSAGMEAPVALAGDKLAGLSAAKRAGIQRRLRIIRTYEASLGERASVMGICQWRRLWIEGWNRSHPADSVTRSTLLRWVARLRDEGIIGLLDASYCAPRASCSGQAWDMFCGLYLSEAQPSIPRLYERVGARAVDEAWAWPSEATIRRWVRQKLDPKLKALGRDPKVYRDRQLPHVERDWTKVSAMSCWIADHRQFDVLFPVLTRDKKGRDKWRWQRPWLTMFMDARSWMPVCWHIAYDSPTGNRVMECFIDGVIEHGKPGQVILDNGKDFRMYRFAGGRKRPARKGEGIVAETAVKPVLDLLGVTSHFTIPYNAKAKTIESFFSIIAEHFDKTWQTYAGRSAERRPERLKKLRGREAELAAGGLTVERFCEAFKAWVMTDYALRKSPSKAAGGMSPARAFAEMRPENYASQRPGIETLMLLMMPSVRVCVKANGIYVGTWGQYYWSDELEDRRGGSGRDQGRKVVYRYRLDDPSAIYVFDGQSDKFLCVATPYVGTGIHPLAEAGSKDAEDLAATMALRRTLDKSYAWQVKELRRMAGNELLASSEAAAGKLGKLDDPRTIAAAAPVVIQLTGQLDVAAQAAAEQKRRKRNTKTAAQSAAELLATGTDDEAPQVLRQGPVSALDLIVAADNEDSSNGKNNRQCDKGED